MTQRINCGCRVSRALPADARAVRTMDRPQNSEIHHTGT
jgi:hypothetical protein